MTNHQWEAIERSLIGLSPQDKLELVEHLGIMWSTTLCPLCCGVHYVAPDLSPASHTSSINLERHITRGDPLEGGPSNPSSASHEPLSAHRQPPPRQDVARGLQ